MRQEGEPSVEEILESIKRVIARDNREAAALERRRRETSGLSSQAATDSLPDEGDDEVLDLGAVASDVVESDDAESDTDPLTNEHAAEAMRQSFAALAVLSEPSVPPQIVRSGETSLEGLVREMLRPMLAQWLDSHLPDMVERMVKAEIARIAGKKG